MYKEISTILALTATNALLQVGHGALASLLIQQGGRLEFSPTALGFLVSSTYAGFLASNLILYRLLPRISFIRTFAVCAAAMSAIALLMPLFPSAWLWAGMRFFHGLFLSAAVIVCDGWLNSQATNQNRSKLWGVFMTANYLSYGAGQYILVVGINAPDNAFMLVSVFLILSLIPMCLTRFAEPQAPGGGEETGMRMRTAYSIAPVAFLGQFCFGLFTGSSLLFIAYLEGLDLSAERQSFLAALFFGAGFILQIPIGWLSDRVRDRRDVMLGISALSAILSVPLIFGSSLPVVALTIVIGLLSAVSATLFSLNIAYGQDFVERNKSAAYAGVLLRIYASGALIGPPISGFLMSTISSNMLFVFLGATMTAATIGTATNRLMPRYRPAHTEQFLPVSPLTATQTIADEVVYSEMDIGPEIPEDTTPEESTTADIGPDLPPDIDLPEILPTDIGPDRPD